MDHGDIKICVKFPRYSNKLRFVTVNINDINKNELVKKSEYQTTFLQAKCKSVKRNNVNFTALEIFRVPNDSTDLQVRLTDNRNASIPEQKLARIIKQFHRSGSFFVQIDFVQDPNIDFVPSIVTPEVMTFVTSY